MRLEAEQVTKQYQMDPKKARFAYALSRTDLVVESGEFAVITGKSGSGKSTLLHILAGLLQPTSGCVLAGGKDLYRMADSELSKFRNENIAVISQGRRKKISVWPGISMERKKRKTSCRS